MKFVEYCDNAENCKLIAAAVSAYSFRKRSSLPDSTEYILYCRDHIKASENPYVKAVFSRVDMPVLDVHRINSPALSSQWERVTWEKFANWCMTPCDGEPVIHADYDVLCLGDVRESIPPESRHFSGRLNPEKGVSCNGGYYVKNPIYDNDAIWETMLSPIYNEESFKKARELWYYSDEIGVAYYFLRHGYSRFYDLDWRYNMSVMRQKRTRESIWKNDIRILHYMGTVKPWQDKSRNRYKAQREHWVRTQEELENEYKIR